MKGITFPYKVFLSFYPQLQGLMGTLICFPLAVEMEVKIPAFTCTTKWKSPPSTETVTICILFLEVNKTGTKNKMGKPVYFLILY